MLEKIDGIIIKTQDYGETHKLVTMFSKRIGKLTALARGAKKTKSRMAAVTQPFIHAQFFVYVNSGLSTIQQGEMMDSFRAIRENIVKTSYAAYITELTDKLLEDKVPDAYLYDQFYQTLSWISENEDADIPVIMYELKLYKKGGFLPTLDRCANCGNTSGPFAFSVDEGGFLCSSCRYLDEWAIGLSEKIAKLLYVFSSVGLERIGSISIKSENKNLLRQLLNSYYDRYGGFYLKSRKFLDQLDELK